MNSYIKNAYKHRTLMFILCIAFVFIFSCVLTMPAFSKNNSALFNSAFLEFRSRPNDYFSPADVSENALVLTSENIDSVTFSFKQNGEWVLITSENNSDLSADTIYQLKIEYYRITAAELLAHDCQMVYEVIPDWFSPNETGVIIHGEEVVADIQAGDGRIVVTFREEWLRQQGNNNLHGSFKISGRVMWDNLPADGEEPQPMPGLNVPLDFEDDLASKYGNITVQKLTPTLEQYGDDFYLLYKIEVASTEERAVIPGVFVKDTFTLNSEYIEGYVGITESLTEPTEFFPQETSNRQLDSDLQLRIEDGSMIWSIGELRPGEARTLTYYAKIAPSYIHSILDSQFKNIAEVFSNDILKADASSEYTPNVSYDLEKEVLEPYIIDETGTGTIDYKITISAPETNSYTLEPITLNDYFPEALRSFLTVRDIRVRNADGEDLSDAVSSFPIEDISLAPGDVITVTYTVELDNIFASGNGNVELINIASLDSDDRTLKQTSNKKIFTQNSWVRKVYGEPLDSAATISILSGDDVYSSDNTRVDNNGDLTFEAPKGSLQYQVVLNEDGRWDLSHSTLKDSFVDQYMHYCGYMQISVYSEPVVGTDQQLGNEALLGRLENKTPFKTVWLDVNSLRSFEFIPSDLGLPSGNYTYLLTYYAKPQNVSSVGSFIASNSFGISGKVGYGDGSSVIIPGMEITVSGVMTGDIKYEIEKDGWYYEKDPVQNVGNNNDYSNGALYWVIRLKGVIPSGDYTINTTAGRDYGRVNGLSGFMIKDKPTNSNFVLDSVAGVFVGPSDIDITEYSSYTELLENASGSDSIFRKMRGNRDNGKYSSVLGLEDLEYMWSATSTEFEGLVFLKPSNSDDNSDDNIAISLDDDEAIYIIVRTTMNSAPVAGNSTYHNTVSVQDGSQPSIEMDTAVMTFTHPLFKENKGAYTYDAETGKYTNCSTSFTVGQNKDTWRPEHLDWDYTRENFGSGTYVPWLLNINYNGTMSGTADVSDILPEGMELAYCDINWIGSKVNNNLPKCVDIPELNDDSNWIRFDKINPTHTNFGNAITYYNPATRELRWKISNLTSDTSLASGREINLRIVCRLTDPETFLSRTAKTYINNASCGDEEVTAFVTIMRDGSMNKQALIDGVVITEKDNGNITNSEQNRLPFSIVINPFNEDLCNGDTLPVLVDELSPGLVLIEGSIDIRYANGDPVMGYSYTTEDRDGGQIIKISGLPDNKKFTIRYDTRSTGKPRYAQKISNNAYWEIYPSDKPQVDGKTFEFWVDGNVFSDSPISIEITKVDYADYTKKLQGASFEIWEVDHSGEKVGDVPILSGVTDAAGMLAFYDQSELLYNRVYCIIETAAPDGYRRDDTPHYFIVLHPEETPDLSDYDPRVAELVECWYDSPVYSYTLPNIKGPITVNKVFKLADGTEFTPTSGSYRFGLFETPNSTVPLEILTIVYSEGSTSYYLDNAMTNEPAFVNFEPDQMYYVYELDSSDRPIRDAQIGVVEGISYRVNYYDKNNNPSNSVIVNGTITIENMDKKHSAELPHNGGSGLKKYYLTGGILLLVSLAAFAIKRRIDLSNKAGNI